MGLMEYLVWLVRRLYINITAGELEDVIMYKVIRLKNIKQSIFSVVK